MLLINLLTCSVASLVLACDARRWASSRQDRPSNSFVAASHQNALTDQLRKTRLNALSSLLFANGIPVSRHPVSRGNAKANVLPHKISLSPPSNPMLPGKYSFPLRSRTTKMGAYDIPEVEEKTWIESHIPVHEERLLYLGGEVNDEMVYRLVAQMIYLDAQSNEPIYMYINSPGGSVVAGLALYDAMQHTTSEVITVNLGMAASTASLILGGGVRGKRVGLASSGIMIHQPASGGAVVGNGAGLDRRVDADQLSRIKDVIVSMYSDMTGHPREKILRDVAYDNYMSAQEALSYGLIDEIIENDPSWDLMP